MISSIARKDNTRVKDLLYEGNKNAQAYDVYVEATEDRLQTTDTVELPKRY
jgi:hypothetical protein